MFVDAVFPQGNEADLLQAAAEFGIRGMCFLYPHDRDFKNRSSSAPRTGKISVFVGALLRPSKPERPSPGILRAARGSKLNRQLIEHGQIDLLYDAEAHPGNDSLHQRSSGLDHVMARLMAEKGIVLGINLRTLRMAGPVERSRLFGRITQNLALAKKYKTQVTILSGAQEPHEMRGQRDLLSLVDILAPGGMSARQVKGALHWRLLQL